MRSLGWALIHCDWCSYKKRRLGHRCIQREDHVNIQGEYESLQAKEKGFRGNHS